MSLSKEALKLDWRDDAKCSNQGLTSMYYPGRDSEVYARDAPRAKAICRGLDNKAPCVALKHCLLYAMLREEEHGIWGGRSRRERNALARKAMKAGIPLETWIETKVRYG